MQVEDIARICHEANAELCETQNDFSQTNWFEAPEWQKQSAINGVKFHLANPNATPEKSHENWLVEKQADGWKYGQTKNAELKEHPCFVPYNQLPKEQQAKDYLFRGIVHSLSAFVNP